MARTAVITGASRGIGKALAISFARDGYDVACIARDEDGLAATIKRVEEAGQRAFAYACDLGDGAALERLRATLKAAHPSVDFFAYLASPTPDPEAEALLSSTVDEQVLSYGHVIFSAGVLLTKSLEESLARSNNSTALFIGSDWALRGAHGPAAFAAAKAGLSHFARSIRRQFAARGIQVSLLLPGDIASYDADWQEAKWDIDDPVTEVIEELGDSRIPLADICDLAKFISARRSCRIEEIIVSPRSGDYDY